jgi:hypothetical protein
MNTSSPRVWIAGTVVLCLALVAAGWFLLVSPQRAEAADLRDQTAAADQRNAQLEVRIAELKEEFAQLPQRRPSSPPSSGPCLPTPSSRCSPVTSSGSRPSPA